MLDSVFGRVAYTAPATLYFGLATRAANKAGQVSEPSGGGYARVAMTNDATRFPAANIGAKSNASVVTFPAPTADWGTIVSLFVADAPTGGNVLAMADLTSPRAISSGAPAPTVAAGAFYLSHT